MKLHLFRELVELNQAFDHVLRGLQRMEKTRFFQDQLIRYARAEVEGARVDANREFFDKFDRIVEDDARWAYHFQREYDRKSADVEDLYLEIKKREETRRKKGLPPRVKVLPNWDLHDEARYDEARAKRRSAKRRRKVTEKRRNPGSAESPHVVHSNTGDTASGESKQ
jgi:hypothetical protein